MDSRIISVSIKGDSMWPTYNDGDVLDCIEYDNQDIKVGDIVVFPHPFKNNIVCVKRAKKLVDNMIFVEGDNPDPLASEDSHNFGLIQIDTIIALNIN
tara:strand:- start:1393 stop:1686 length:294 start_codon:yes stop_codon:yes gene_type:complete